jgi:archaeosortase A (PGF-CTERM-specific)
VLLDPLLAGLEAVGVLSAPLGWGAIALFFLGAAVEYYDREYARPVVVVGWVAFGLFWFSLIHTFFVDARSVVEGVGSVLAVPLSLYLGVLLARGRDSLFVFSRAVAIMGIVYFSAVAVPAVQQPLIEMTTSHTEFLMTLLGFDPTVVSGTTITYPDGSVVDIASKDDPYRSTFVYDTTDVAHMDTPRLTYTIVMACTGIGSMAIFVGLIAAVDAPWERKLRAFAVSVPVIYVLNLFRNVFIGLTFGHQMTYVAPDLVTSLFALEESWMVAYIISDRIVAQGLSVVALVAITWLVVRELPEVLTIIEDVLYVLTRNEYDLQDALGFHPPETEADADPDPV